MTQKYKTQIYLFSLNPLIQNAYSKHFKSFPSLLKLNLEAIECCLIPVCGITFLFQVKQTFTVRRIHVSVSGHSERANSHWSLLSERFCCWRRSWWGWSVRWAGECCPWASVDSCSAPSTTSAARRQQPSTPRRRLADPTNTPRIKNDSQFTVHCVSKEPNTRQSGIAVRAK